MTSWHIEGDKVEALTDLLLLGSDVTADGDCSHEITSRQESYGKPRQYIKKQGYHFADKGPYSQGYSLSSCHVLM